MVNGAYADKRGASSERDAPDRVHRSDPPSRHPAKYVCHIGNGDSCRVAKRRQAFASHNHTGDTHRDLTAPERSGSSRRKKKQTAASGRAICHEHLYTVDVSTRTFDKGQR